MGLSSLILLQQSQHCTAVEVLSNLMGAPLVGKGNEAWAPEQQKWCQELQLTVGKGHCCLRGPSQKVQSNW